jgi:membrane protease YdiL (CAAX protease family)
MIPAPAAYQLLSSEAIAHRRHSTLGFPTMNDPQAESQNQVPLAIGFEASLTLVALAIGWLVGEQPFSTLAWRPRDLGVGILATLPLFAGLWLMVRFPRGPCGELMRVMNEFLETMFQQATWWDLAIVSLMAGIGEELLFRGVVQAALARWSGSMLVGLLGAGVLFGLVHSVTRTYAILAGLVGIYFGWLWLATENLLVPITAHAVYDFGALWYLTRVHKKRV